jgi:hypothetical protein
MEDSAFVVRVPSTPLPPALTKSDEFSALSEHTRKEFLAQIRYMQEVPFKLREWLENGSRAHELHALVLRIDLDISVHLGIPVPSLMQISAHAVRSTWVTHVKPLVTWLAPDHAKCLNFTVPQVGASISEVATWLTQSAAALSDLFDGFFNARNYETAIAYLVSIHVHLAGIKFGLGRVELRYPE